MYRALKQAAINDHADMKEGLKNPALWIDKAYMAGSWIESEKSVEVTNPADGSVIGAVPDLGAEDTLQAIEAAEAAYPAWSKMLAKDRAEILRRWADLMRANQNDLAHIMTLEQGKPLAESFGEIEYAASFLEWFGEEAKRAYGDTIPSHLQGSKMLVSKQPVGVTAAITPWNFPSAMITRKAGAALAAGVQ